MFTTNRRLMAVILIGILFLTTIWVIGCKKKSESTESPQTNITDVTEQKLCPVMNAPINKERYTEYQGKKVYFCCPGCKEKFEKEPEKYLDKLPQFK